MTREPAAPEVSAQRRAAALAGWTPERRATRQMRPPEPTPALRAACAAAARAEWQDPAHRATVCPKLATAATARWQRPSYRAAQAKAWDRRREREDLTDDEIERRYQAALAAIRRRNRCQNLDAG